MDRVKTLQALLNKHEVTQTELAERLGVKQATISAYITGKSKINYSRWDEILEALGETNDSIVSEPPAEEYKVTKLYDSNLDNFYQNTINMLNESNKIVNESNKILANQIDRLTTIIDKLITQTG